jgi:predicted Rossmann fold nucleotide-binding protein DprA/Smf involved in DNA uptake
MGIDRARSAQTRIERESELYPGSLRQYLGADAPGYLTTVGDPRTLSLRSIALFCSERCSGRLILVAYDLVRALRRTHFTVISGFHSPLEREMLPFLLRGRQPVISCPARRLSNRRVPPDHQRAITEGRLLLLSPFAETVRRPDRRVAWQRNRFVAALADEVLIVHASAGSRMLEFAREVLKWGKPVMAPAAEENEPLFAIGVTPVTPDYALAPRSRHRET